VAASRGREIARIYTDDRDSLLDAVTNSEDRLSAIEFMAEREHRQRGQVVRRLERHRQAERESARVVEREGVNYER
jgi:hypothetical protein